jgi:von Willebrand factor type D domain
VLGLGVGWVLNFGIFKNFKIKISKPTPPPPQPPLQLQKIRVISRQEVIECQPEQHQGHQQQEQQPKKIQCTLNGQAVKPHQHQQAVEYNNDDQSSVTINGPGVQVRFNGKKAWIKLSKLYKNKQCGLCGHYDEDSDNDLRMGDTNEPTSDVEKFHRSYTIADGQECSAEDQNSFYNTKKAAFRREREQQSRSEQRSQEEDETDDSWWGTTPRHAMTQSHVGCLPLNSTSYSDPPPPTCKWLDPDGCHKCTDDCMALFSPISVEYCVCMSYCGVAGRLPRGGILKLGATAGG